MNIGVFSHFYNGMTPEQMASNLRKDGFDCVQLYLSTMAEVPHHPAGLNQAKCERIRKAFEAEGVKIVTVGAFANIAHVNPDKRREALELVVHTSRWVKALGTDIVSTMTGSFNEHDEWSDHPNNHTSEGLEEILPIVREMGEVTRKDGVKLCFEPYYHSIGSTAERMLQLIDAAGVNTGVMYDPAAMVGPDRIHDSAQALKHDFELLFPYIQIVHVEDVRFTEGQPTFVRPGQGGIQWDEYYKLLRDYGWSDNVIIECNEDVAEQRLEILTGLRR